MATQTFDQSHGETQPVNRFVDPDHADAQAFNDQVQPILASRCIVCHACYDAPCQLKLSSPEGIDRGLHPEQVYNGTRLLAAPPTRLFEDAPSTQAWRDKGFEPILNERNQNAVANHEASLLYRSLRLKQQHPNPSVDILPGSFELGLSRAQQCLPVERYNEIERFRPLWGMPYALPALSDPEHKALSNWIARGAPMPLPARLPTKTQQRVDRWERFFNGASLQHQLMSRYLYEHLYLFNLYFDAGDKNQYFKLVRSATPPGKPIQRIATRRPFDDPGVPRVYYRLWPDHSTVVAKSHIPYSLSNNRQQRWQSLFLDPSITIEALPGYKPEEASNPFITFAAIPYQSRYRFLLDEAQNTIMAFIKGPVCRGQMAVNVINEQFWVFFVSPDLPVSEDSVMPMARSLQKLSLPAAASSNTLPLTTWLRFAALQGPYLETKSRVFNRELKSGLTLDERLVWDGDGSNGTAALTVFRHFDNASVVKGLVGRPPKTAWLIDYPLLERIHYLLVAGFDVYGNIGHQFVTRLSMDFLRMEGEFNFLTLLPREARKRERDFWYRDAGPDIQNFIFGAHSKIHQEPAIDYQSDNPKLELYQRLTRRLSPILSHRYEVASNPLSKATVEQLQRLEQHQGGGLSFLPESVLILFETEQGDEGLLSLLHHRAHANISSLFDEQGALRPQEDRVTAVRGVIGVHPNLLVSLKAHQLPQFVKQLINVDSEAAYGEWVSRFGIRRTRPDFWAYSDRIHQLYQTSQPRSYGVLDYSRLENR